MSIVSQHIFSLRQTRREFLMGGLKLYFIQILISLVCSFAPMIFVAFKISLDDLALLYLLATLLICLLFFPYKRLYQGYLQKIGHNRNWFYLAVASYLISLCFTLMITIQLQGWASGNIAGQLGQVFADTQKTETHLDPLMTVTLINILNSIILYAGTLICLAIFYCLPASKPSMRAAYS